MNVSDDRENLVDPGLQKRPPILLRALLTVAMLGLLAGVMALAISLGGVSRNSLSGLAIDQTGYPVPATTVVNSPVPTWTPASYPGPETFTPSPTNSATPVTGTTSTPNLTLTETKTATAGTTAYPGPVTSTLSTSPTLTPTGTLATSTPSPTATIFDPSEQTPLPFVVTIVPTRTPVPSPTAVSLAVSNWCVPWNTKSQFVLIKKVIDGVTVEIEVDGEIFQVRYIGVDLPAQVGTVAYEQALEFNRSLVEGKWATLIEERSDLNLQGQYVRYVLAGGKFINHELVRMGLAIAQSYPPDVSCDSLFAEAESLAKAAQVGVWAALAAPTRTLVPSPTSPITSGDVRVVYIEPRGEGWQDPEEFVEIRNYSSFTIQLQGWSLSDTKGHKFIFPDLILKSGGYCRIYTNLYSPETCGLSYYSLSAIWDDAGDCAYLRDQFGNLVSQLCY